MIEAAQKQEPKNRIIHREFAHQYTVWGTKGIDPYAAVKLLITGIKGLTRVMI
jgi:hypothetical protein